MRFMLGVDEAGRGPLAGPVAVGVVAVPDGFDVAGEFPGVTDSKKLSEKKREKLFEMLEARVAKGDAHFVVEFESAETIDNEGISTAVHRALARGINTLVEELGRKSDFHIMLDGALRAPEEYSQETIIHGDALVPTISLASIVAKVMRDRLMTEYSKKYPHYGFEKHKGYGTRAHYDAIKTHGLCDIHRRSFLRRLPFSPHV